MIDKHCNVRSPLSHSSFIWSARESIGAPGMVVLQFAFGSRPDNTHLPHMHHPNSVVYPGLFKYWIPVEVSGPNQLILSDSVTLDHNSADLEI